MPTVHLIIQGKVQGVFYRASAKKTADTIGIMGWVKNTNAGHVEILAKGNTADLEVFINWCKQGPPKALVTNLLVTEKEEEAFTTFEVFR